MSTATIANPASHSREDIPETWEDLTDTYPLRPIHDDADLDAATQVLDIMAGHDLTADQEDYLEALATLVDAYETEHYPVNVSRRTRGIPALKAVMEDQGMNQQDLASLLHIHKGHASKIMSGERSLTIEHLRLLSKRFNVHAELFLSPM